MPSPEISFDTHYTYSDYVQWPDEERWELIHGVAYTMLPAPSTHHQRISMAMSGMIWSFLRGKSCSVYTAPFDIRLPEAGQSVEETDSVVQPDVSVFCEPEKIDDKGAVGAPDWVIEILSPSTARKDESTKLLLYQNHGVKEYWIVDPEQNQLTIHCLQDDTLRFGVPQQVDAAATVSPSLFPGLEINLAEVMA